MAIVVTIRTQRAIRQLLPCIRSIEDQLLVATRSAKNAEEDQGANDMETTCQSVNGLSGPT